MNEVKNITDHYGNSQTYNAYKNILDKILNSTLFWNRLPWHTLPAHGKDPVNILIKILMISSALFEMYLCLLF